MGLGFAWYSPIMFGARWMREMNYTPEGLERLKNSNTPKGMARTYSLSTLMTLITAFVLSALLNSLIITSISGLFLMAFLMWLAFSMPVAANYVMFGKDSLMLFAINTGYQLLCLVLMVLIIGFFG